MKQSILAVSVVVMVAIAGKPELAQAQAEKSADELGPVAEWVLKDGLDKTLDDAVTLRLGLGDAGVGIRHKGYRTTGDDMRHAFAVIPKGNTIVMSHTDADNNGYIWRTTRAGVLLMTLKRDGTAMKVIPNSQSAAAFEAEKKYFLSKVAVTAAKQ